MATLSDNSKRSVNADAVWQSSNTAVATVDAGVVKGVSAGEADISVSYQNVNARLHIVITAAPNVTAVSVTGTAPRLGATSQFAASATVADNTVIDVTSQAVWSSSNVSVATVVGGVVTGVAAGQADVSATFQNKTGTTRVVIAESVCSFSVSATTLSVIAAGGTVTVNVAVVQQGANCHWAASSSSSFVTITSGASGDGDGVVSMSVAANTGAARSAVVTIAGRQVTVSQAGGNCAAISAPSSTFYSAELKRSAVFVTAPPGCAWTATSNASFVVLTSGSPGTGNGTVFYTIFGNLTGSSRSAAITVGDTMFTMQQNRAQTQNFLSFVSDAGDSIGQGETWELESFLSNLSVMTEPSRNHVLFRIDGSDGRMPVTWGLDLAAPQGQQLKTGTYSNAARYGFQAPAAPGLAFAGNGRFCNTLTGQFTITDLVFAADGSVQRLAASFEQHCEGAGAALRGNVSYVR